MKICFVLNPCSVAAIKLEQRGIESFRVTYGKEVKDRLTYSDAAKALGQALMHSLSCDGAVDNREKGEARNLADQLEIDRRKDVRRLQRAWFKRHG